MYINKKIELRGSFPLIVNESFKNNLKQKKKRSLNNSLSMNNISIIHQTSRQFGKDIKNIINLTVNTNNFSKNENIEEKIKYYKTIKDDLTKILNDYDKNYFEKNKKLFLKKINEEKYILNENYLIQNIQKNKNDENKSRNKKIEKIINKDNNISYFENNYEDKFEKLKNKSEMHMVKTVNINIINKDKYKYFNDKNINIKKETKKEDTNFNIDIEKKSEDIKENKDNNKIVEKNTINNINKENNKDNILANYNMNLKTNENINENKNITNPQEVDEYILMKIKILLIHKK